MPRLTSGLEQIFTNLGIVGSGYKLYFFVTATSTPKTTYSNEALTIPNTNPIVLNAAGRPDTDVWGIDLSMYRMVLGTPDSTISTVLLNPVVDVDPIDVMDSGNIVAFNPIPTAFWGTTAGTSTHYTLDPALVPITSYSNTQTFFIDFHTACAAGADIDIDSIGVVNLKKFTGAGTKTALQAGDTQVQRYIGINDGADIVILNPEIKQLLIANNLKANTSLQGALLIDNPIIISNNVADANNDIDFAAGVCRSRTSNYMFNLAAITKRLDANWAAGTGNGGLDTGSKTLNTWYYCYGIFNSTTGVSDAIFTATFDSPTLPSGYTIAGYIGAIRTSAGNNILAFTQVDDIFTWSTSVLDLNAVSTTAGADTSFTITAPRNTKAFGSGFQNTTQAGDVTLKVYSASMSMATLTALNGQFIASSGSYNGAATWEAITSSSSQIKRNCIKTTANEQFSLFTDGWVDLNL